jgi:hypothetical protein
MVMDFVTPNGVLVIGPGAVLTGSSDLLPLANPPYTWVWRFEAPDLTFNFTQQVVTTTVTEQPRITVQWDAEGAPIQLLQNIHANVSDSIKVTLEVRDVEGARIDGPFIKQVPWQPQAWAHSNARLWSDNIVARVTAGGTPDAKLDSILAAVYRTWPGA